MAKRSRMARRRQHAAERVRRFAARVYGASRVPHLWPDWRELWRLVREIS